MNASLPVISALVGVVVLFFGRRLFWLCVAALGFAAGIELAPHLVQQPTPILELTFALVFGFVGALLALLLQKIAVAIVGFVAGGRLAVGLGASFFVDPTAAYWLTFLIGGVIGAILLIALFDWALIVVSALIGAHLLVRGIVLPETGATLLFVGLTALGVIVQAMAYRRGRVVESGT